VREEEGMEDEEWGMGEWRIGERRGREGFFMIL